MGKTLAKPPLECCRFIAASHTCAGLTRRICAKNGVIAGKAAVVVSAFDVPAIQELRTPVSAVVGRTYPDRPQSRQGAQASGSKPMCFALPRGALGRRSWVCAANAAASCLARSGADPFSSQWKGPKGVFVGPALGAWYTPARICPITGSALETSVRAPDAQRGNPPDRCESAS